MSCMVVVCCWCLRGVAAVSWVSHLQSSRAVVVSLRSSHAVAAVVCSSRGVAAAVSWRVQVRGGGGRYAFAPRTRRAGALMQCHGLVRCARRPRTAMAPAPRLQRIDAIAQGCERPKRCGASFALQTSRAVPHGCRKRTARVLNLYEGCCDAGTHGVRFVCCSNSAEPGPAWHLNGEIKCALKWLQCVSYLCFDTCSGKTDGRTRDASSKL